MHLQVKARVPKSGMSVDDDGDHDHHDGKMAISATYEAGALLGILDVLAADGFNLRSASGSNVELGGELTFWVDGRSESEDEDAANHAAAELLRANGYDADVWEVHSAYLVDKPGALRAFVDEVTQGKLLVQEISVSTPDADGIPVQIFTAKVRRHPARD
jgi:hypothetical protein